MMEEPTNAVSGQSVPECTSGMVDNLVTFYAEHVSQVGAIIDTTFQILQESPNHFAGMKEEQEQINAELREQLARTSSLRRKDFDRMMQDLLQSQRKQESEAKDSLNAYVNEQKAVAQGLREGLNGIREAETEGKLTGVRNLRKLVVETSARQEKCRSEMTAKLREFQQKQEALTSELKELLARGEDLRIGDFKLMLERFKTDREKRLVRRQERKDETANLLRGFRKQRTNGETGDGRRETVSGFRSPVPLPTNP